MSFNCLIDNMLTFLEKFVFGKDNEDTKIKCTQKISKSTSTGLNSDLDLKYKRIKITDGDEDYPVCIPEGDLTGLSSDDVACQTESDEESVEEEYEHCEKADDEAAQSDDNQLSDDSIGQDDTTEETFKTTTVRKNIVKSTKSYKRRSSSPIVFLNKRKRETSPCNLLSNIVMAVGEKCIKNKLKSIEETAKKLWIDRSYSMKEFASCNVLNSKWEILMSHQKLPFYWATISGDFVREKPFDNFLRFYLAENSLQENDLHSDQFAVLKKIWAKLHQREKMPFIVESFMYQVQLGQLNLKDDNHIIKILEDLHQEQR